MMRKTMCALFGAVAVACASAWSADTEVEEQATIRLPLAKTPVAVDGTFKAGEYDDAVILGGAFKSWMGVNPVPNSPIVYVKRDAERIYIAYDNPIGEGERPRMTAAIRDTTGVCSDNAVELYFMPAHDKGAIVWFVQFGGNPRGAIFDTKRTPQIGISDVAAYSPQWGFKNTIVPGHWYSEVSQSFATLGITKTGNGDFFDIDFCRDGGCGAWGYEAAYASIVDRKGVKAIFDDTAPAVQWLSFGEFEKHQFDPKLRLKSLGTAGTYIVDVRVTADKEDPNTKKFPELFSKTETLALGAGETKDFSVQFALAEKSAGIAFYRITAAKGETVFYRRLPFKTDNAAVPYPKTEPRPIVAKARMAPSFGRILATADILDLPCDKSKVRVDVSVTSEKPDAPLATGAIKDFTYDFGQAILQVSKGSLPAGTYSVTLKAMDKDTGKPLGFEDKVTLERKIYEWENNNLGVTDKAFHPWPALKVDGDKAIAWGRDYQFTGLGLPSSIMTLQPEPSRGEKVRDVLAGPVRLVAQSGGKKLAWKEGTKTVKRISEVQIDVTGSAEADGLKAELGGTLELDGFYKIHLKLTPTGAVPLDSIRVEVPLPTEAARLFNHSAENMRENKTFADFEGMPDGVIWNSKDAARNMLVAGNFLPTVWIGDEDRGVAWMCNNDRTWATDLNKACLDVLRQGDETAFRMHLLNAPCELKKPIEVTFSLQATPIKPRPEGGSWKKERDYGWNYFDAPLIWTDCFDESKSKRAEDHVRYIDEQAQKDGRWWRYFCFNSDRIGEDEPTYGPMVRDFAAEWYIDAPLSFVQDKSHTDFILWAYKQWHDKKGLTGVYHDNTFAVSWPGLINDVGWIDDEGRVRAGYWVMEYREFAKRERAYWLSVTTPPVMKAHITDAPIAGYLGWCDFWLDGENGGYPDFQKVKDPDFVDRWYNRKGMANLRITLGRQWGTMPQYLYAWGKDSTEAVLGLFDLRYGTMMAKNPRYKFGWDEADCEYIPYWDTRKIVQVKKGGPDVLYAAWKRPGRSRIMISNLSDEDRDVTVKVDTGQLGLPPSAIATDEQAFSTLDFEDGKIRNLTVNRHNYRLILLGPPDEFTPIDPWRGKGLVPKKILFQDDFSALRKDWQTIASPLARSLPGPQKETFTSIAGHLRILSSTWTYAAIYRPIPEDNCSVQVNIRQAAASHYGPGFQPMLGLYWDKDTYVRILSGQDGVKTAADGAVGGKNGFRKEGELSGIQNWVKITLTPESILFDYSLDGFAWKRLHTQPRAGFEKAPAFVFVGHGAPGPNSLFQNESHQERYQFYSYYKDFFIGKE